MYNNGNITSGGYYYASPNEMQMPVYTQTPLQQPAKVKKEKGGFGRFCKRVLLSACLGLCFGLCAGAGLYAVGKSTGFFEKLEAVYNTPIESDVQTTPTPTVESVDNMAPVVNTTNITAVTSDVSDMVEEVMPAMVSIVNTYTERYSYFGQTVEREAGSSGSGIIVGENETEILIATNYHVVEDADELTVNFIDGTEARAIIKGTDQDMDLAVIAVSFNDLSLETREAITIAKLGDSDSLKLGEPVVAIGNALGYGQSVTGGWISALDREVELEDGSTGTFIQTDAAINPGNSGGALLNVNGEVIGINSNKIGGAIIDGIGYAIPISAAQPILEDLMLRETRNKVDEANMGYLGIVPESVTAEAAQIYGMPQGVFVSRVDEGTPAAEGGILQGDIITKFDGIKLLYANDLREMLEYYAAGETVEIQIMRIENGEWRERTLEIVLGSRPLANR
ncbi:MAG: trypsin-like peptidase domain-containing protein [Lachnospiraceae bacterium]|nr:trypsin-like peptidase domain-containing protein [Lachnospiraceae bacterium]